MPTPHRNVPQVPRPFPFTALALVVAAGCGGGDGGNPADAAGAADASGPADMATAPAANIATALNCGMPKMGAGPRSGDMQMHSADTSKFPDALCNDGSPGTLFFRPWRGDPANKNRWVISLRGGGTCGSAESCAARWCSCDTKMRCPFAAETTNFSLSNMSSIDGAQSVTGGGVLLRDAKNPLGDYNQVQLTYCTSDGWKGQLRGQTYTTTHPITGQMVTYTLNFTGARALDAHITTLRQDGVPALVYTLDGGSTTMPDLDDATDVVFPGDSAGGAGVINNLDYLASTLRAHHNGCNGGAACPPRVVGIMDAVVGPDRSRLDWSASAAGAAGLDTYDKAMAAALKSPIESNARRDASCVEYHKSRPGTEGYCTDEMHLVRHHLSTPFFVRMALLDALISRLYIEFGFKDPKTGPLTLLSFAQILQNELSDFPKMKAMAEEGDAITVPPGVFAPSCTKHDTIHTDSEVYGVQITSGGKTYSFFDVFTPWATGQMPPAVLSSDPMRKDTVCPP